MILVIGCSLKRQPILVGNWKPIKVSYNDAWSNSKIIVYQKNENDSIKRFLIQKEILEYKNNPDSAIIKLDTIDFKERLENTFRNYDSSKLIFKNDSTFYLESFGLITPTAAPYWYFGDKVTGSWAERKGTLQLKIGDKKNSYTFYFKIIKKEKDKLTISQIVENYMLNRIELERY